MCWQSLHVLYSTCAALGSTARRKLGCFKSVGDTYIRHDLGAAEHRTQRAASIATATKMASEEMAVHCFDVLLAHFAGEDAPSPPFADGSFPLFVTWKKTVNGGEARLRGCIGTLEARCVLTAVQDYALTSALRDRRFPPIQAKEIPLLEVTVSLLTNYEQAEGHLDWEIGRHGMILEFTDPRLNIRRSATYLPEVAEQEGWTQVEAIDSLIRKAGYSGPISDSLRRRLRITRYQSSLFTMTFHDYVQYVELNRGYTPIAPGPVNRWESSMGLGNFAFSS
jgi:uncharacterized protein (TIGR00296 family)